MGKLKGLSFAAPVDSKGRITDKIIPLTVIESSIIMLRFNEKNTDNTPIISCQSPANFLLKRPVNEIELPYDSIELHRNRSTCADKCDLSIQGDEVLSDVPSRPYNPDPKTQTKEEWYMDYDKKG
jgi:hypothetical protein